MDPNSYSNEYLRANESAIYFVAAFNHVAHKNSILHSYLRKHPDVTRGQINTQKQLIADWASASSIEFVRDLEFAGFCH